MSVKLVLSEKCCQPKELGAYSFCRRNTTGKSNADSNSKDTKLYLDLEEYRKSCQSLPADSVLTVPVNFGVVPVDKTVFYEISLTHPRVERIPRYLQLEYENPTEEKFDDVFRITFTNSNAANCVTKENKYSVYTRGKTEREAKFRVYFQPELPSMLYNDSFTILADNNPMRFQCRGFSEGPSLCFSQNIINFGSTVVQTETKRVIEISNLSCCLAHFQFDVDNNRSLFKICPTSGSVAAMESMQLEVTFKPEMPQCYYKRIHCLVHHQSSQFLDVIGLAVPNTFAFTNKEIYLNVNTEESNFIPFPSVSADEYFKRNLWGIKLHQDHINFDFHDIYSEQNNPSKKLNMSSRLPYDVVIKWIRDASQIFQVVPTEQILQSSGSVDFNVIFLPKFPDSFFSGQLECYIYPLSYSWPAESGPPWVCGKPKKHKKKHPVRTHGHHVKDKEPGQKKKIKCAKLPHIDEETTDTIEGTKDKVDKLSYVPLEIRLQQYNNTKGKLILLKPKRQPSLNKSNTKKRKSVKNTDAEQNTPVSGSGGAGDSPTSQQLNTPKTSSTENDAVNENSETSDVQGRGGKVKSKTPSLEKCESNENTAKECNRPLEGLSQDVGEQGQSGSPQYSSKDSKTNSKTSKGKKRKNFNDDNRSHIKTVGSEYFPTVYDNLALRKFQKSIKLPQAVIEVALPLCRSVYVSGHTFGMTNPPHIAQAEVPSHIAMGPTLPQKRVCGTAIIRNKSDLPAFFEVKYIDKKTGYRIKPRSGVIPGGKSQILLTNLSPRLLNTSKYIAKSVISMNLHDNFQTELIGMAQIPHLTILICYDSAIPNNKGIVCPITVPGCCTDTYIEFINYSRFHYRYILEPKHLDSEDWQIFLPTPNKGYLTPNERVRIQWKFVPLEPKVYKVCWRFRFSVVKSGNDLTLTKGSDYEMKMYLTGVSQPCTIQASVNLLDFGVIQIFDKDTKTFTIKNMGKYSARAKLSLLHDQWLKNFPKGLVTINLSRIQLAPEESVEVIVHVRPTRTDIQKFYIEYQLDLTEVDEYGDVLFEAEPVRLVDIKFMGDHALFKVTDVMMISRHPYLSTEHCWHMFSLTKLNELLAPLRNVARENTIPHIETVTFRFPPAPIYSEPTIVTLMLSSVSDSANRNAISTWEIISETIQEPTVRSMSYCAELQKIHKQRKSSFSGWDSRDSPEFLNILWKEKSSGKKTSAIKQPGKVGTKGVAVVHGRNHSVRNSGMSTITENPLTAPKPMFSFVPTHGNIKNKSGQTVTFKFSYNEAGTHTMTILLRVYPAIFVWIELNGRTLEPYQAYIQYMCKDVMRLHPVSLSDMDPPIQMFWVYNGGNVPCTYEVDQKTFDLWKENNYGHSVMECLNPLGIVPPRSWYPIKVRFSPLEYEKYKVPLKIISENHEETIVNLEGSVSLDSVMHVRLTSIIESSCTRKYNIINPLVPVSVCPSLVSFQHFIPTGEKCTSIVFVTNLSSKHKMSFNWPVFPIEGGGSITFHPQSKLMEPNEEVTCMLQVKAGRNSVALSCMIRCMIEDETANAQYEEDLEVYMDSQRLWRSKHFNNKLPPVGTIENKKFGMDKMPAKPEKPENFSRVLAVSLYIGTAFGMLDKLPPEELSKLPFSDPICQPLTEKINSLATLPFSRHMSQEIISQMLWEIINGPTFKGFARRVSRRQPPFFYEYKEAEDVDPGNEEVDESRILPTQTTEEVLEYTIYNMLQEMTNNYSRNDQSTWYDLMNQEDPDLEISQEEMVRLDPCFVRFPTS